MKTARVVAALLPVLLAAASCGISGERSARIITPPPLTLGTGHHTQATGSVPERLFLVKDGRLEPVTRQVDTVPSLDALGADLLAGPTDAERRAGYTSSLPNTGMVSTIGRDGPQAVVGLADSADQTRTDQVLGFGQIVCTLTDLPGVVSVSFRHAGRPIAVPRADGSLSDKPLTAADYQSLTVAAS